MTTTWLKANMSMVFGYPNLVRFSWQTTSRLLEDAACAVNWWVDCVEHCCSPNITWSVTTVAWRAMFNFASHFCQIGLNVDAQHFFAWSTLLLSHANECMTLLLLFKPPAFVAFNLSFGAYGSYELANGHRVDFNAHVSCVLPWHVSHREHDAEDPGQALLTFAKAPCTEFKDSRSSDDKPEENVPTKPFTAQNTTLLTMASSGKSRHSYFRARKLQRVDAPLWICNGWPISSCKKYIMATLKRVLKFAFYIDVCLCSLWASLMSCERCCCSLTNRGQGLLHMV